MVLVATQVKRRRGTTAENNAFTGAEGEIVVDTERHELRVHDGVTQGGFTIPTTNTADFASKSLDNLSQSGEARFTNKANSDLSNTPLNVDYVVESQEPTAENGYTWYRKYKSGWVEQGGRATTDSGNPCAISLPVQMANIYYNINILGQTAVDGYSNAQWQVMSISTATTPKSTTGFYGQPSITGYNLLFYWQVSGKSAQ